MTTSNELRRSFIDYFKKLDHLEVSSASLVPDNDPTLLFTNAGMNQFKRIFLGQEKPPAPRVVDSQKCLRVSGKHNDLEEVGRDEHHHTFFEMLGNWSFDDYYKAEAIEFAWNYLTKELSLPADRLWPTVFRDDTETRTLWPKITGIPRNRVLLFDEKDNFWEMGDVGPCGPCTEIHFDYGGSRGPDFPASGPNDPRNDRWIEIWNLVFIQYHRDETGALTELGKRFVDTGMGFERLLALLQGVPGNYRTDLFLPIMDDLSRLAGGKHTVETDPVAFRAIADHVRTLAFGIADGVLPSNEGQGYVLRRILRRAARYGRKLGLEEPFLHSLCRTVVSSMGDAYAELQEAEEQIAGIVNAEEVNFAVTLDRGLALYRKEKARISQTETRIIPAETVFRLYDTYGFPPDLTSLMAGEEGFSVDLDGFKRLMEERRRDSRESTAEVFAADVLLKTEDGDESCLFIGYESFSSETCVAATVPPEGISTDSRGFVILEETPFYPEGGGQVADTGSLSSEGMSANVLDAKRDDTGTIVLTVEVTTGSVSPHDIVTATVDESRRLRIQAHHTGTHLLHAALRRVLGSHVKQAGSLVAPDKLRFDFNHFRPLSEDEIASIQDVVNRWVEMDIQISVDTDIPLVEAKEAGAIAFFGEKYGDRVRIVSVPGVSKELCGGTHMDRTARVGAFWILSEGSIASGVRRIEAVCGRALLDRTMELNDKLDTVRHILGASDDIAARLVKLKEHVTDIEQQLQEARTAVISSQLDAIINRGIAECGIRIVAGNMPMGNPGSLRSAADTIRSRERMTVLVLTHYDRESGRMYIMAAATDDVIERGGHAGKLISQIAGTLGGKGGGRAHLAEGGVKMETAPEAFSDTLIELIRRYLRDHVCP